MSMVRALTEVKPSGRFKTQATIRIVSLRLKLFLFASLREKFLFLAGGAEQA
jgi:hypothetical protein